MIDIFDARSYERLSRGPSVAVEFGALLPDSNGDNRFGAAVGLGDRSLNNAVELTRDQRADVFTDLIIEGPFKWVLRPVAEFFYEEEFGRAHILWIGRRHLAGQ